MLVVKMLKFAAVLLAIHIIYISHVLCDDSIDESLFEYYEKLINTASNDALNYTYPDNFRRFIQEPKHNKVKKIETKYDFIVIGGGSAGSVIVNRLSEIKSWNVLLLEAGNSGNNLTDIPAMSTLVQLSDTNWGYKTTPQRNCCLGYENSQCTYPRGRLLGGSSSINALVNTIGNPYDYDSWAAAGNVGWAWKDVQSYFIKLENAHLPNSDFDHHGHDGPMWAEYSRAFGTIGSVFLEGSSEMGRKTVDYNGKNQHGASVIQMSTKNGKRWSTEHGYLDPIKRRSNVKIITSALVTKILINKITKTAYGVRFVHGGNTYEVTAKEEVILSAGTFNSPHLLMLSGVGPKETLLKHKITPIKDLRVGFNYHDHPRTMGLMFSTNLTFDPTHREILSQFLFNGTGPYTCYDSQALSFINTPISTVKTRPDIEHLLMWYKVDNLSIKTVPKSLGWTEETTKAILEPIMGKWTWQLSSMLLHTRSRGLVTLKSADPFDFPLVDVNYFSDPDGYDLERQVEAILDTFKISETYAFRKIDSKYTSAQIKGCENYEFKSRDYWRCYVRHLTYTTYHAAGTCKMGPKNDPTAVVNNKLQVYGIKGLRVVDGSVMPSPMSGHNNVPILMIAEKIADDIKMDYNKL